MSTVGIFYEGQNTEVELNVLIPHEDRAGLGIAEDAELDPQELTAKQIKQALANHFDKPVAEFEELIVENHKTGNITVRPNATFGT